MTANQECYRLNVTGINTTGLVAGFIEIFNGTHWGAVYDTGWDQKGAELVCQELGFPPEGNYKANIVC